MNDQLFLEKMSQILEVSKEDINGDLKLDDSNWDSVAHLATIAIIDELGITVPTREITECSSVGALLELIHRYVESPLKA